MFPTVLRSDNAIEFTSAVVRSMNQMLDVKHIASSTYHPQQGKVERLHRTLNSVVRGLVEDHPEDWEERLPYCECILRMTPMKVLGGRSPYEVVTCFKPRLPAALNARSQVEFVTMDEYASRLRAYFTET